MEERITELLDNHAAGCLSRRQLIAGLMGLVATSKLAVAADFQTKTLDHVSLVVKDAKRSADFYMRVFGLQIMKPSVAAVAGGALEDGSIRLGLDHTLLVLRPGKQHGVVDHFAFGVDPFDQGSLPKALGAIGIKSYDDPKVIGFHVKDPDGMPVQFTNSKR